MQKRLAIAFVAALTSGLAIVPQAGADVTKNGRFVFYPRLGNDDPVTLLFHGGRDVGLSALCIGNNRRSAECVRSHMRSDWNRGRMDDRVCNGGATLRFRRQSGGSTGPVGQDKNLSTSNTCRRQFHTRIWDDVEHGHPDGPHLWDVAAIHHETRGWREGGHRIDQHWESVENIAIIQMGRAARNQSSDHPHCTYHDYYPLPGSGPGKIAGWYSNGRISRISFQHIDDGGCRGA